MTEPTLYGLCELARELGLPESTTRYYRDAFSQFVPSVGHGRKRRYPEEALSVLRFIAESFAVGRTREEIGSLLSQQASHSSAPSDTAESGTSEVPPGIASLPIQSQPSAEDREQKDLMWQMIRELSRFGDAIERQHYILSELVDHVFHGSSRQLPPSGNGGELETVLEAEIVQEIDESRGSGNDERDGPTRDEVESLRKALETERELVDKLRESKLELERRAAAAEAELEETQGQPSNLLRRLFERDRNR